MTFSCSGLGGQGLVTTVSPQDGLELIIRLQIKLFMPLSPSRRDFLSLTTQAEATSGSGGCLLKGIWSASAERSQNVPRWLWFLALERPLWHCVRVGILGPGPEEYIWTNSEQAGLRHVWQQAGSVQNLEEARAKSVSRQVGQAPGQQAGAASSQEPS